MMHVSLTLLAGLLMFIAAPEQRATDAPPLQSNLRIWEGAYSSEQAARGKSEYEHNCASCHGGELQGRSALGLKGDTFMRNWREDSVSSLFNRIKSTMPRGNPATLSPDVYLEIVIYILQVNGFPEGNRPLTMDSLKNLQIVGKDGPQEVPDFSLITVVGCLTDGGGGTWNLTNASTPLRTRNPEDPTPEEFKMAESRELGSATFQLLNVRYVRPGFKAEGLKDHRVEVKGFLIRQPDSRINVTSIQTIRSSCR